MNFLLIGEAGSGKDTVATLLPGFHRLAFGDELSLVCRNLRVNGVEAAYSQLSKLFGVNVPPTLWRKLGEFRQIPRELPKDRRLMQDLGTWCREYDDNIWIRPVLLSAIGRESSVITDCRRIREFEAFDWFTSVYIDASLVTRMERLRNRDGNVDASMFHHKAEQEIVGLRDRCDYVVDNNGSTEELREKIMEVLRNAENSQ